MKKIMIAAAIVCAAAFAQAAAFTWKTGAGSSNKVNGPGTGATYSGMAYLFDSSAASTVFANWVAGTALADMASLDASAISSGSIATKSEDKAFQSSADPFVGVFASETVIEGQKYLYISANSESTPAVSVGSQAVTFKGNGATSGAAAMDIAGGYQGAGWYTAAAPVPEPTSGLLLLLGVAGMALRRRRA